MQAAGDAQVAQVGRWADFSPALSNEAAVQQVGVAEMAQAFAGTHVHPDAQMRAGPGLAARALLDGRNGTASGIPSLIALALLLGLTTAATVALDHRAFRGSDERTAGAATNTRGRGESRNAGLFATELMPEIRSWGNGPAGDDGFLSAR